MWASRMHLHLEGLELLDMIKAHNAPKKKWLEMMSIMLSTILDEIRSELDVEKFAFET